MIKIEAVITVWQNGLFKSKDRIEANDTDGLEEQIQIVLEKIHNTRVESLKLDVVDDDDIPF